MKNSTSSLLELSHVSKIYEMGGEKFFAVNDVSLKIFTGEFVSIIGPSGSGKSTLMHLVGILDNPTSGEILLEGQNVAKLKEKDLARIRNQKIGFIFQAFNLLPKTPAIANVELPLIYSKTKGSLRANIAKKMLIEVGLGDKTQNLPNQLSGGQQQRVAIARALANDPAIILGDEPTGNLDSKSGKEIMQILKDLNAKGRTIVLVTHDANVAAQTKRIIQIQDGKIISDRKNLEFN